MKNIFRKKTDVRKTLVELQAGKAYILFAEDEKDARELKEAVELIIGNLDPEPHVLIVPVESKPRILYFD